MAEEDPDEAVSFTFDPDAEGEPAATIVRAVAWAEDAEPTELEPLEGVVDVDALIDLLSGEPPVGYRAVNRSAPVDLRVCFGYEGYRVRVEDGRVWLVAD